MLGPFSVKIPRLLLACALIAAAAGCRPSFNRGLDGESGKVATPLSLTPNLKSLYAGQVFAFNALGGLPPYTYQLVSGGGTIDPSSGHLSTSQTSGTVVVRVTDLLGNQAEVTALVSSLLTAPAGLSYSPASPYSFRKDLAVTPLRPVQASGHLADTYSVTPALPAGLTLDPATGVISGAPTVTAAQANYQVTAANSIGSTQATLSIEVLDAGFTIATPTEGRGVNAHQVFSGACTNGTPVTLSYSTDASGPASAACSSSAYSFVARFEGAPGARSVTASQGGASQVRNVVYSPSGVNSAQGWNGSINAILPDVANRKIYIGGDFTIVGSASRVRMARLHWNGSLDTSFTVGTGFNAVVSSIQMDAAGKLYVAGNFTDFNGTAINRMVRLNADGSLDGTFSIGTGFNANVLGLRLDSAGKIYAYGSFMSVDGNAVGRIARLNANGSFDNTFAQGTGFNGDVYAIGFNPAGTALYAGGNFTQYNAVTTGRVVRLLVSGARDATFSPASGPNATAQRLEVSPTTGKIYIGGFFNTYDGYTVPGLIRLHTNGARDTSFTNGGYASHLALNAATEEIYSAYNSLLKYSALGASDTSFPLWQCATSCTSLVIADNQIYLAAMNGGPVSQYQGSASRPALIRLSLAGVMDSSFNAPPVIQGSVSGIAASGSRIFLVGSGTVLGRAFNGMLALTTAGGLHAAFVPATDSQSYVTPLGDGSGGAYASMFLSHVRHFNADGSVDAGFNASLGLTGYSVALDPAGGVFLGGQVSIVNNTPVPGIAKLLSDGTLDPAFNPGTGFTGTIPTPNGTSVGIVYSGALLNDAIPANRRLYAVGSFGRYNGTGANGIARITLAGALDAAFVYGTGFNSNPSYVGLDTNTSKIYVNGGFTTYQGAAVKSPVRIDSVGTVDAAFNLGTGFNVTPSAVHWDAYTGKLYCGGTFTTLNGVAVNSLVRLNADGSVDPTFQIGTGPKGSLSDIRTTSTGQVVVRGPTSFNGIATPGLFVLEPDGSLTTSAMYLFPMNPSLPTGGTLSFAAGGGSPSYAYSIVSGGGSINSGSGAFTAPNVAGTVVVRATDADGVTATSTVTVYPALAISPSSRNLGQSETVGLSATGGVPPYSYALLSGPGSLTGADYTAPASYGSAVVVVTDTAGNRSEAVLTTHPPLTMTPAAITLETGSAYTFNGEGGAPPYTYLLVSGSGTLNALGRYTAPNTPGNAVIRVRDALGVTQDAAVTITGGSAALALSPASATVAVSTAYQFSGVGGAPPYTFAVTAGGGSVNATTGVYTAPAGAGAATLQITDSLGSVATGSIAIGSALALSPLAPNLALSGQTTFTATGGSPPYFYDVISGNGSMGLLSGVFTAPSTPGSALVRVTDAVGFSQTTVVTTVPDLVLTPTSGNVPIGALVQLAASGGLAPYSFTKTAGVGSVSLLTGWFDPGTSPGSSTIQLTDALGTQRNATLTVITAPPGSLAYSNGDYTMSLAITPNAPTIKGGVPTSYSISPALPAGLSIHPTTGVISGTPTVGSAATQYTVTGSNSAGSTTATLSLSVIAATLTVASPTENQTVHTLEVFSGVCTSGPSVTVTLSGDTTPLATSSCLNSAYSIPIRFSGDVSARTLLVSQAGTTITRNVNYNPTILLGNGPNGAVQSIFLEPGTGKLLIAGQFNVVGHYARTGMARLNTDGSLDPTFSVGTALSGTTSGLAGDKVYAIARDPVSGKLYLGGTIYNTSLIRVNADGSLDTSFVARTPDYEGLNGSVFALAYDSVSDKLYVAGDFTLFSHASRNRILRLNSDGSLDTTFDPGTGFDAKVTALALDTANSLLYVGGDFANFNGTARVRMAALNLDGSLAAFNPGAGFNGLVNALALDGAGGIYVGGAFTTAVGSSRPGIARVTTAGALDAAFTPGTGVVRADATAGTVTQVVYIPGAPAKVLIAGTFATYNGSARAGIARIGTNGAVDATFTTGAGIGGATINSLAYDSGTGAIFAGGSFKAYGTASANGAVKLQSTGARDAAFDTRAGFDSGPTTLSIDTSTGKVYAGGGFSVFQEYARAGIARLNTDGTLDTGFNPGTGFNGGVNAVKFDPVSGLVYVGGAFTSFNGTGRNRIARLNLDGTLDTTFNPGSGFNGDVNSLDVDPVSGQVYAGGSFSSYAGTSRDSVARLNTDGSLDTTFNPGTGANLYATALAYDPALGKVYLGGWIDTYNGTAVKCLVRINSNGSLDSGFNNSACGSSSNQIYGIVINPANQKVYVSGQFTSFAGSSDWWGSSLNSDGTYNSETHPSSFLPTGALAWDPVNIRFCIGGAVNSCYTMPGSTSSSFSLSFGLGTNGTIGGADAIAVHPVSGIMYFAGEFNSTANSVFIGFTIVRPNGSVGP